MTLLTELSHVAVSMLQGLSNHWVLFVLFVAMIASMAGVFGRGLGVQNIFHDDPALIDYWRQRRSIWVFLNSPAIFSQFGAVLYLIIAWGMAFLLGGPEGPPRDLAGFRLIVGIQVVIFSLVVFAVGTVLRSANTVQRQPGEVWRCALGILLGWVLGWVMLWLASAAGPWIAGQLDLGPAAGAGLALAAQAGAVILFTLNYRKLIPAISLISVLALLALGYVGMSAISPTWRPLVVAAVLAWLVLANGGLAMLTGTRPRLKFSLPGILTQSGADHYAPENLLDLDAFFKTQSRAAPLGPLDADALLGPWLERARIAQGRDKPKMVLVATSGGAYRAGFWTAMVLDRLVAEDQANRLRGFAGAVRLITGASGGMVGAAYFAARARPDTGPVGGTLAAIEADVLRAQSEPDPATTRTIAGAEPLPPPDMAPGFADGATAFDMDRPAGSARLTPTGAFRYRSRAPIPRDSLSPVAQQLVQRDIPGLFWPSTRDNDRGRVLEDQWLTLDVSFRDLAMGELQGWRPSMVLSPTLAETGQPLLISNLDMDLLIKDRANETVEFFDLFPHSRGSFKLKTAVRLNASFPYISPDTALPTEPYRRVVDAGYYDNYGVDLAAAFLGNPDIRKWLIRACSGVVLVEIRAFPAPGPLPAPPGPLARALQTLTTPIEAALAARGSTMIFRNRQTFRQVRQAYDDQSPGFIYWAQFEVDTKTSLNWYLPEHELAEMRDQLDPTRAQSSDATANCARANLRELQELIAIWNHNT